MNNELFIVQPSLKQIYGRTITKEMEFDEKTDDNKVHQILKDLVLTTKVETEHEFNGIKTKEESTLIQELPEGTILLWDEHMGYIIPSVPVYKLKDLEKEIEEIKEIYKDNTDINPEEK
jgi:hypothetical protein